ncbi:MAG: phycobilisome rod-core linker polypeptide [Pseudanabaena sp.]|jgi:phycocyanin-associated rod linker protein|uniref:phycobilisome linker polypeptide n=1 Tax=Pseudanabaena mucicola TaxID=71190 RepID=UPI0025767A5B|nr:phycobilisome linker polypeptide [Pseudanabaena mucicola]MCA6523584.1 phycobilisome linker polypeptide [Pseudanabaena sp. M051S1SP2A07QC]MCA6572177.1 phycobilisome linker polypeptide [Pseudanabaena sp. M53BS1SP1A06MG]MCA6584785.1 phycobilisome linker polypeptide [Pseudanabaena sp. M34BS1SP1A06MG]MCA6588340.1 phycobilisome linker polypeptide [Pseudanabaena sp. M109S1SP1A06QC]MCA6593855.1 phycobilisome linker polypeptide [Pseudanabaena sp. M38BS1SP1A06MG]MCA6600878.1 phycobilisome linker pol
MAITNAASSLGTAAYSNASPVELRPNFSQDDVKVVINAVYRHVLGNDYILAADRLVGLESLLTNGQITVREFVRAVAKSELYKSKFLYPNFHTRVIELNFKHLLGRAPFSEAEVIEHLDRYQNEGYDADIDSYIDSDEYETSFGDAVVPYYRGFTNKVGDRTVGFTRIFRLYRGYANSDRAQVAGSASRLATELAQNSVSPIVGASGGNAGWAYQPAKQGNTPTRAFGRSSVGSEDRLYRIEVAAISLPRYPQVRRSNREYIVSYKELNNTLQRISKLGGKVASVTIAQ